MKPLTELQPENQVTLPEEVVISTGLRTGDALYVTTDGARILITVHASETPEGSRTMRDLFGAASGLYGSREEADAEIERSRIGHGD